MLITGSVADVALLADFQTRQMVVCVLVSAFSDAYDQLHISLHQTRSCIGNYYVVTLDM